MPELHGRTLGCWCAPLGGLDGDLDGRICHGEVLAALADGTPEEPDVSPADISERQRAHERARREEREAAERMNRFLDRD